ncbi:flavodoxin family protein [Chloroflexota bacterium]
MRGLKRHREKEAHLSELKEVASDQLSGYDAILVGSPNHIGGATRGIRKFIDRLGKLNLEGKAVAVFDTYAGRAYQQATGKMEKQLAKKAPGLSIRVEGMKGPISEGELPRCREFGSKLAAQLKG